MKILSLIVVLSVCCYTSALPRKMKPKDFDQRQSASSYAYHSDHTGPHVLFVTGQGAPHYDNSGYHTVSGYSKPTEYQSKYDTGNGAHSYVIKHVTGGKGDYPSSKSYSHHETSPLHHRSSSYDSDEPIKAEIHDTSHESIEHEVPVAAYDSGVDSGVDSGSVEHLEEVEHDSGPAHYTHGTFHHHNGGHSDDGQSFHKGHKDTYDQDYYKKHGDKGKKSYDKAHKEAKGNKGHYDHSDAEGHHNEKGGHAKSNYDEGDKYASKHEEGYAKKGGKHGKCKVTPEKKSKVVF